MGLCLTILSSCGTKSNNDYGKMSEAELETLAENGNEEANLQLGRLAISKMDFFLCHSKNL